MAMMQMPWVLVVMIGFLVLLVGGVLVGIRLLAARSDPEPPDHPTAAEPGSTGGAGRVEG